MIFVYLWRPIHALSSQITTTFDLVENTPISLPPSPKYALRSHGVRITWMATKDFTREISLPGHLDRDANVTSTGRVESTKMLSLSRRNGKASGDTSFRE